MKTKTSYLKYLAALLMFGTNGIVASFIDLNSYEIVLARLLIGTTLLIVVFVLSRQKVQLFKAKKQMIFLAVSGIAMGASWMFLYEAYQQIGVSIASLAYYCGPVIVMIASPVLFRERLTWAKAAGFVTVLAGMVCVNAKALCEGKTYWGLFCGAMSALMYAAMVICNKKAEKITGLENSVWQLLAALMTVTVFVGVKQGFALHISSKDWIPILILGTVNTGVGCYLYFSSIGNLPVQTVAVCGYLEPLSAVLFSVIFLHENMSAIQIAGAVMILGGASFGELFRSSHSMRIQPKA